MGTRKKTAIIIGAGPAGLTAAYELLARTDITPVILEKDRAMGGIARTVEHKGYRMDVGGHRFFSKSDRVMTWWLRMLPLQRLDAGGTGIAYQGQRREVRGGQDGPDPETEDRVMLVRPRRSRIHFDGKLFDYPLRLDAATLRKLGARRILRIAASYARSALMPIRPETNLEEFYINRFGRELYGTFFKDYTEKVWGVPCREISAEWGAQRVKGLSVARTLAHAVGKAFRRDGGIGQKGTETSLIERFLYPKYGPGQMWEEVASKVKAMGGTIVTGLDVRGLEVSGRRIVAVEAAGSDGRTERFAADHVISTMPIRDLVRAMRTDVPPDVREVSEGLRYRDFITVGVLVPKAALRGELAGIDDNWIYVQDRGVRVGRLQFFDNWSPYLVPDRSKTWIGMEYFCDEGDALWRMDDAAIAALAAGELEALGVARRGDVLDALTVRMPKAYPAYFGTYGRFPVLRSWLDGFENLHLVGRNGMHKYNNQDHSMLTAMTVVDGIAAGRTDKAAVWAVNTEHDYHEERA